MLISSSSETSVFTTQRCTPSRCSWALKLNGGVVRRCLVHCVWCTHCLFCSALGGRCKWQVRSFTAKWKTIIVLWQQSLSWTWQLIKVTSYRCMPIFKYIYMYCWVHSANNRCRLTDCVKNTNSEFGCCRVAELCVSIVWIWENLNRGQRF